MRPGTFDHRKDPAFGAFVGKGEQAISGFEAGFPFMRGQGGGGFGRNPADWPTIFRMAFVLVFTRRRDEHPEIRGMGHGFSFAGLIKPCRLLLPA